jgi:hypothetical protein
MTVASTGVVVGERPARHHPIQHAGHAETHKNAIPVEDATAATSR